jgi:hypothetical protein
LKDFLKDSLKDFLLNYNFNKVHKNTVKTAAKGWEGEDGGRSWKETAMACDHVSTFLIFVSGLV